MTAIDISRDGRTVVYAMPWVAVGDGHETAIGAYDVASGRARVAFRVAGFTSDVLLAPDGRHAYALVLHSSGGSSIVVADVTTGAVDHLSTGFGDLVDVSDDGAWLLVNRVDRTVVVDVATGAVVDVPLDAGQAPLGFGTTSSTIVLLEHDEEPAVPALLDLATSATRPLPTVDGVRTAAVSRGGRALALGATADIEGRNPDGSDELHLQPLAGSRIQVTEVAGTRAGGLLPTAVDDLGRTAAFVAAGTLDPAGRGTVADTFASTVHVARCAGSVLARTG